MSQANKITSYFKKLDHNTERQEIEMPSVAYKSPGTSQLKTGSLDSSKLKSPSQTNISSTSSSKMHSPSLSNNKVTIPKLQNGKNVALKSPSGNSNKTTNPSKNLSQKSPQQTIKSPSNTTKSSSPTSKISETSTQKTSSISKTISKVSVQKSQPSKTQKSQLNKNSTQNIQNSSKTVGNDPSSPIKSKKAKMNVDNNPIVMLDDVGDVSLNSNNRTPTMKPPNMRNSSPKLASTNPRDLTLPTQRIKMIMKSCPDVETVPQESLHLITRATELFIQYLAQESLESSESTARLDYEALSLVVDTTDHLDFLKETVPKKITWAECQKLIEEKNDKLEEYL